MSKSKKIVLMAILGSLGTIIGLLEQLIPLPFIAPGVRLGLSNIVVLTSLISFGLKEGIGVSLLKSVLLMLVTGNVSSFMYSFAGAFMSSISMAVIIRFSNKYFSLIGVSMVGSAFHNLAQVIVSALVLSNIKMFSYLPILLILGLFTSYFVGLSVDYIVRTLSKSIPIKNKEWLL